MLVAWLFVAGPVASGGARATPRGADRARAATFLTADARAFLTGLNDYRATVGRAPVTPLPTLTAAAAWYAADLARNDSFSHSHIDSLGRNIAQRYTDFGYTGRHPLGEASVEGPQTPAEALAAFRASRPHDAILRDPRLRAVGIGTATMAADDPDPQTFWVASFGSTATPPPR